MDDPEWISKAKCVQESLKIKVLRIASNRTCVGLVVTNPTQFEWAQTNTICERYRGLFVLPNKQNFDDCAVCTVRTVLTWQLTIQVVQTYIALTWQLTVQ
jgi:hypothetical protein